MPTERYYPGVASVDNKIYVTGGGDGDVQSLSRVDCYNLDTNTWSQMASMNIARMGHSLVNLCGRLHAIGGVDENGNVVDSSEVYDPNTNTWTCHNTNWR